MSMISYEDDFCKVAGGTGADVMRLAQDVAKGFYRRRSTGDPDDWVGDAAAQVVESVRRYKKPLSDRNWHAMAANCAVALARNRALAVVSLSEYAARQAVQFSNRTPLIGCGYQRADEDATDPSDALEIGGGPWAGDRADEAERQRARAALVAHLGAHVARMAAADRRVLEPMLGLRGSEPMDSDEVCWATGATPVFVANAVARLAARVRGDRVAHRLRRADRDA